MILILVILSTSYPPPKKTNKQKTKQKNKTRYKLSFVSLQAQLQLMQHKISQIWLDFMKLLFFTFFPAYPIYTMWVKEKVCGCAGFLASIVHPPSVSRWSSSIDGIRKQLAETLLLGENTDHHIQSGQNVFLPVSFCLFFIHYASWE